MKKVAVINDISGFGKCSLTAAIPAISVQGVQVCPLTTAVFSNQTGYPEYFYRDMTEDIPEIIRQWRNLGAEFDAVLTGFFSDVRQVEYVRDFCRKFRTEDNLLIVDPVMADNGKIYSAYSDELCKAVISLASAADIITPNLTEFAVITGFDYDRFISGAYTQKRTELIVDKARALIRCTDIKCIIVTSVPAYEGKISNCIITENEFDIVSATAFDGSFSGTGDLFAAAVCGGIVKGESVFDAVSRASIFIEASVKATITEGTRPEEGICFEPFLKLL